MPKHFSPIGHTFLNEALLTAALTHRSKAPECDCRSGEEQDNQRLEFLGDAVLDLVVSEHLFRVRPKLSEGNMSRLRACFVRENRLADIARSLDLGKHLIVSQPEDNSGGRDKNSLLADALEALLGAVFLDAGHEAVKNLVQRLWEPYFVCARTGTPDITDHKTALQEYTQSRGMGLPEYSLANTVGPAHHPTFFINVRIGNRASSTAMAHSKKEAHQLAAKALLKELIEEESSLE
ncbi:MAG: ribonuclease III [Deltaproteobacteria bacterium]|jgi:ribonuclease-3|nr:ribonuclease III [Deltaproteobacteria bacterium]